MGASYDRSHSNFMSETDKLDPPNRCDACNSENISFITNTEAGHKAYRKWPWIYFCNDCKASVGCHPDTVTPLGFMAGIETRRLRSELHRILDPYWQTGQWTRVEIYQWLASVLDLDEAYCHIATLSVAQLELAIKACRESTIEVTDEQYYDRDDKQDRKNRESKRRRKTAFQSFKRVW